MNIILSFAAAACFLWAFPAQEPAPAKQSTEGKYPLEAIMVLTPAQCSEESKKGNWVIVGAWMSSWLWMTLAAWDLLSLT
jgi:hypothetical protein